ncbi:MAG: amidohydrolase family protein [Acidobacteria bacterium]|nr:amidohydrolase family protein [Acidobacteriota bacterium]
MSRKQAILASLVTVCAGTVLGFVPPSGSAAGLEADLVIYNGKILTLNSPDPQNYQTAQAAAIYDGKFVAVGSNDEVLQYAGAGTKKIDLGGRTVLPGLVESHDHVHDYANHFFPGGRKPNVDPPLVWTTKDEGLAQLKTLTLSKKPGEWINTSLRGGGFGNTGGNEAAILVAHAIQKAELTKADLDKAAPNNPIRITNIFFSPTGDSFVNTKGLDLLLKRYPNISGVHRDAKGVPTGWLSGVADRTPDYEFYAPMAPEQLGPPYAKELEEVAAQGLTTVSTRLTPQDVAAYSWLDKRGDLPIRFAYTSEALSRNANAEGTFTRLVGIQGGKGKEMWSAGNDMLWLIGVAATFSIDSIANIGGACVRKPYPREAREFPLWLHQFYGANGLCRLEDPNYDDANGLWLAAKYGFRSVATHAAGDKGIDLYFDVLDKIVKEYPDIVQQRWTLEHCQMLHEDQIVRAAKFNIMFSCGPLFLYTGMGASSILNGEEEGGNAMVPMRSLLNRGLRALIELDAHGRHPMAALQVAVTRKDINGKVWGAKQAISRLEALYSYTRWSGEFVLREDALGSIEPKKLADFVVLNRDYLTVPEDEIGRIDPVLTVVGGKFAYTDPDFATSQGLPQVGYRGPRTWWIRGGPEDRNRSFGGGGGGG